MFLKKVFVFLLGRIHNQGYSGEIRTTPHKAEIIHLTHTITTITTIYVKIVEDDIGNLDDE